MSGGVFDGGIRSDDVELRDLIPGDIGWLVMKHAELYAQSDGFDATFEALVAEILVAFRREHDPMRERGWIATAHGHRLGSIFCVKSDTEGVAKLRLFLLLPEARGLGLGHRMLTTCLEYARAVGYRSMRLWTHESHRAACALYDKHGFQLTKRVATTSFGADVVEQVWERDL